jgi:sec-independent protein translocase protein TatA
MGLENPSHLLILFVIVLLLFGPKRLPELGRSLGRGIREFKGSITGSTETDAADPAEPAAEHQRKARPPSTP